MKAAVLRIAGTSLFDDVEVTLDEVKLPLPAPTRGTAALASGPEPVYTMIRQEGEAADYFSSACPCWAPA